MALTQRFGFTHFGADAEGSLFDDGGKFTGRDRRVLDRILAAFEVHDHSGGTRVADPSFAPTVQLSTSGGVLPSGTTFHYRVSFIDRFGMETAASEEVSIETPGAVAPPGSPAVEAKPGGTLAQGLYWYAVSVLSDGNETQLSPPQVIQVTDWNSVAISSFEDLPLGADEVSVWRQGPLESGFTRLVTMPVPADLEEYFLDDGSIAADPCACDPENLPPEENFTNATNAAIINIPAEAVAASTGVQRWRIYRTEDSGVYSASSLVAEVVETATEEGDDLVTEFVDTGETIGLGQPLETSQTLTPSVEIEGSGGHSLFLALAPEGGGPAWRVVAERDGAPGTRPLGLVADEGDLAGIILTDAEGGLWAVLVDEEGELSTSQTLPTTSRVHAHGKGPDLPTSDPLATRRLAVDVDGSLFTEGVVMPAPPSPGGFGSGATFLSSSSATFRLVASLEGELVLRSSGSTRVDVHVLVGPGGETFLLEVGEGGTVQTVPIEGLPEDAIVHGHDRGPLLPSPDPHVLFELSVGADGALITTEA